MHVVFRPFALAALPAVLVSLPARSADDRGKIILLLTGVEKQPILKVLMENPDSIPAGKVLKDHPNVEVWVSA